MKTWKCILTFLVIVIMHSLVLASRLPLVKLGKPAIFAQGTVTVSIETPAQVGENIADLVVKVNVNDVTNFDIRQFDVAYDPGVLQVIGAEGGNTGVTAGQIGVTSIPTDIWGFIPPGTQGKIRLITNVPGAPGVSGSGYVAKIHFDVVGAPGSTSALTLVKVLLGDNQGNSIPVPQLLHGSVVVTRLLDADFSATSGIAGQPTQGYAGVTQFQFSNATSGGTQPYTHAWDFNNDGTIDSTEPNPRYVFPTAGSYTVRLTVTDSLPGGSVNTEVKTHYVTVHPPLAAVATVNSTEGTATCSGFSFTGATSGGNPPYSWAWDMNSDGTVDSTEQNPRYIFPTAGTYTARFTVTDGLGTSQSASLIITGYKLGDVNGDQDVNILDVAKVERIILELDATKTGADANCDIVIDVLDITRIERIIVGL